MLAGRVISIVESLTAPGPEREKVIAVLEKVNIGGMTPVAVIRRLVFVTVERIRKGENHGK